MIKLVKSQEKGKTTRVTWRRDITCVLSFNRYLRSPPMHQALYQVLGRQ